MKTLEVFIVIFSSSVNNRFRWLEGGFSGTLPPNFVHKQKFDQWPLQLYKTKMEIFYDQRCDDIGDS